MLGRLPVVFLEWSNRLHPFHQLGGRSSWNFFSLLCSGCCSSPLGRAYAEGRGDHDDSTTGGTARGGRAKAIFDIWVPSMRRNAFFIPSPLRALAPGPGEHRLGVRGFASPRLVFDGSHGMGIIAL